jgi:hypothetical protein
MFLAAEVMTKQEAADDLHGSLPILERSLRAGPIPVVTCGCRMLRRKEALDAVRCTHERRWGSTPQLRGRRMGHQRRRDKA